MYACMHVTLLYLGKLTGSLDLGLSFIHCDGSSRRINIDGDHHVIHLKVRYIVSLQRTVRTQIMVFVGRKFMVCVVGCLNIAAYGQHKP